MKQTILKHLKESKSPELIKKYSTEVRNLMDDIENRYEVNLFIYYNKWAHLISLDKIVIPKENRGKGIGSKVMEEIINYADQNELRIALTPTSDFGGTKSRLVTFYKSFGFKKYKGYEVKQSMIRLPELNW